MSDYETQQHDVLVIGAGGAGLRAAIEASAAGVSVGLVCKSLLGKAHTVMAHGGTPRQGSARSRTRTGGMGCGFLSHEGRAHSPKEFRWTSIPASRPRRR